MTLECRHEETFFLEKSWPTGESIEVCKQCRKSRAHWEMGESDWILIEDLDEARRDLEDALAKSIPHVEKVYDSIAERRGLPILKDLRRTKR